MLRVIIPTYCTSELKYTCYVVFTEWLGISYELKSSLQDYILISDANKELKLATDFFMKSQAAWLHKNSLPLLPLKKYNIRLLHNILKQAIHIQATEIPVLYGEPNISVNQDKIACDIDIFGSIFFMLSRYEEIVIRERDNHDRFSAKSSVAYKEQFLFRPIVNEYIELLFSLLQYLFPQLKRKKMYFKISPTHDVDVPFRYLNVSLPRLVRHMGGDVLRRKSMLLAFDTLSRWQNINNGKLEKDPYYSFDFIMTQSEKRSLKSSFYFLPSSSPEMDVKYPVTTSEMHNLLQVIDKRGHEIGIHGFYGTYLNTVAFKSDVLLLQKTLESLKITQAIKGGRQHYLQWRNPETFTIWENAGIEYDSSLSFADMPGFRCGTCYEYSVYDCIARKQLNLKERPLIAMECSVIAERYMDLGLTDKALKVFKALKDTCRYYSGDFILLFHNSEFITTQQKEFYINVLDA
ncbi:MAG: polysaccharide deacetylase family protein [Treponema sp.]|uniref:polysaccharide deacetylase family protein n=1 Tax=Treponema sp. TaxID=166 RepID=UPI003FA1D61B